MKRPKWAVRKNLRYKVVTSLLCSPIAGAFRTNLSTSNKGTVLQYVVGEVIKSPNGVSTTKRLSCYRGIHAYKTLNGAIANKGYNDEILRVYAPKWHGPRSSSKCRAGRVYVAGVVNNRKFRLCFSYNW